MSLTMYIQGEMEAVTAMTEMLNPPTQLVTELRRAYGTKQLEELLAKIEVKISVAADRDELMHYNRLFWAVYFVLTEKQNAKENTDAVSEDGI